MSTRLPFFPPDLFEESRRAAYEIVRKVGLSESQQFILGPAVARLEETIAQATGVRHVIACASGTGGLNLAVQALNIGPGDEVVVPAFCCQPVASSVANRGATPVFVDVDPWTMVIDPASVEAALGQRTVAIMPAHVFSVMADMPAMRQIAERHGVKVIEDAAVAQGAVLDGTAAGRWGDLGVFSFFQVKALGTIGEGGVVLTDDQELADRCRRQRNHGQTQRFVHTDIGQNCRMDEITAQFLLHRWPGLQQRLERRADIADYYTQRFTPLRDQGLLPPPSGRDGRCYYVYSVLTDQRDELRKHLAAQSIDTHVYYPLPLPQQPAFARFSAGRRFPNAESAGRRNLALPIWPHMTDNEVERVANAVVEFYI
ncbi:DegT/DnrJ/EryC1/StrS family aminotransferase [Streptomyces collinus]|uniref:DegT/DnrJ/EryC1/StrS family aminotransferase n=1 Tax=Streptomyces collinus TaxID=42684 RepID=UPI0036C14918